MLPVSSEDKEAFISLYQRAYKGLEEYAYVKPEDIEYYFNWLLKRDKEGFVKIFYKGKLAGFCACDSNWKTREGEKVLAIHEIFIHPEFRGLGLGQKLIAWAEDYAKKKNLNVIELWVGEKNFKAQRFYQKCGFKEGFQKGKWIKMIKSL